MQNFSKITWNWGKKTKQNLADSSFVAQNWLNFEWISSHIAIKGENDTKFADFLSNCTRPGIMEKYVLQSAKNKQTWIDPFLIWRIPGPRHVIRLNRWYSVQFRLLTWTCTKDHLLSRPASLDQLLCLPKTGSTVFQIILPGAPPDLGWIFFQGWAVRYDHLLQLKDRKQRNGPITRYTWVNYHMQGYKRDQDQSWEIPDIATAS